MHHPEESSALVSVSHWRRLVQERSRLIQTKASKELTKAAPVINSLGMRCNVELNIDEIRVAYKYVNTFFSN
jgi:hypothetical protein